MSDIKINDVRPRVQYVQGVGDAAVSVFDFPFPVLDAADLRVAVDTTVLGAADFSISGIGAENGGSVTLALQPAGGSRVTLWRDMPFQRTTDFTPGADLRAAVLNDELDRTALLLQQAEALVGDSIHRRPYDEDVELVLPSIEERAGRLLSFDSQGRPEATVARINTDIANFALIYLGARNTVNEPVVRLDGLPLQAGDLYFNTDSRTMRAFSGDSWVDAYLPDTAYLRADGDVSLTADLDFGGHNLVNIGTVNGRDMDGVFTLLDTLVEGPEAPVDQVARDMTILNAFEIARMDGLTAHAMANTYLDTFADNSGVADGGFSANANYDSEEGFYSGVQSTVDRFGGSWVQDGSYPALSSISAGFIDGNGGNAACYYAKAFSGDFRMSFTMGGSGTGGSELALVPVGQEASMATIMAYGSGGVRINGLSYYWSTFNVSTVAVVTNNSAWGGFWYNGSNISPVPADWGVGTVLTFERVGPRLKVWRGGIVHFDHPSWGGEDVYLWFSHADGHNPDWTGASATEFGLDAMTVTSVPIAAAAEPGTARVILAAEAVDSPSFTLNTDLIAEVSRDDGSTWVQAVLDIIAVPSGTVGVYAGTADLNTAASGNTLRLRVRVPSAMNIRIHKWAVQTDQLLTA
ncbi:hypothetical protein HH303_12045 [Rhodospirillaceae bacterium KN72]|uniref:Uncharacterized protein n=1 Tax=Pacificispira spongiicola TaxID=2729598 RepID=A0A7Y0HEY8_9PROT|nr:hypothetical protein [Pacificispira spongiicola]NMM45215.1 hypothetical protein [Pacificispira spongiicola]